MQLSSFFGCNLRRGKKSNRKKSIRRQSKISTMPCRWVFSCDFYGSDDFGCIGRGYFKRIGPLRCPSLKASHYESSPYFCRFSELISTFFCFLNLCKDFLFGVSQAYILNTTTFLIIIIYIFF